MFQVNRAANRLNRLEEKRFSDLKLREREHLQEWLANQPDALGEDLLIIQTLEKAGVSKIKIGLFKNAAIKLIVSKAVTLIL